MVHRGMQSQCIQGETDFQILWGVYQKFDEWIKKHRTRRKIIKSIIWMFILIRSRIILSLAVINICPAVKFIAHDLTVWSNTSSLSPSLYVSPMFSSLAHPFLLNLKRCHVLKWLSLNRQILLDVVLIWTDSLYEIWFKHHLLNEMKVYNNVEL
jgi:hypothetical protein